jgi:hypothetical protein
MQYQTITPRNSKIAASLANRVESNISLSVAAAAA